MSALTGMSRVAEMIVVASAQLTTTESADTPFNPLATEKRTALMPPIAAAPDTDRAVPTAISHGTSATHAR